MTLIYPHYSNFKLHFVIQSILPRKTNQENSYKIFLRSIYYYFFLELFLLHFYFFCISLFFKIIFWIFFPRIFFIWLFFRIFSNRKLILIFNCSYPSWSRASEIQGRHWRLPKGHIVQSWNGGEKYLANKRSHRSWKNCINS